MNMGVPVVVAAGNDGANFNIHSIPPVLEGSDHPLITAGAADKDGRRACWNRNTRGSNGDPQLTTYAVAARVLV